MGSVEDILYGERRVLYPDFGRCYINQYMQGGKELKEFYPPVK